MATHDLTLGMREALLQIGFGTWGCDDGFYDEANERVDLRSVRALALRGLVFYYATGGNPTRGMLDLTEEGERLFEEIVSA